MINERSIENSMLRPCVHDPRYDDEPATRTFEVVVRQVWSGTFTVEAHNQEEAEDIAWDKYCGMSINDLEFEDEEFEVREE